VWVNGPFKCGSWSDIKIYRRDLKQKLRVGEMVEADSGYQDDTTIGNVDAFMALFFCHYCNNTTFV
jgi:hypothetical protein